VKKTINSLFCFALVPFSLHTGLKWDLRKDGRVWNILEPFGTFWNFLEHFDLELFGTSWNSEFESQSPEVVNFSFQPITMALPAMRKSGSREVIHTKGK